MIWWLQGFVLLWLARVVVVRAVPVSDNLQGAQDLVILILGTKLFLRGNTIS